MKNKQYQPKPARDSINPYALNLEEAQTEIRKVIKTAYLQQRTKAQTAPKVLDIIRKAIKDIKIATLKQDAYRSLIAFADKQYTIWQESGIPPEMLLLWAVASHNISALTNGQQETLRRFVGQFSAQPFTAPVYEQRSVQGVPLQQYYAEVWKDKVKPIFDDLLQSKALDPNDERSRNTLRNLAEMEVRYRDHQDNIAELRGAGVKICECSSHSDCSDRCAPWQGRLYSLDGTSGTINGIPYVPLEQATDHYYTTKAGRTYKNGLLGFNCKHFLRVYNGKSLMPRVPAEEQKREYKITRTQRAMEVEVRKWREEAALNKGIDKEEYRKARAKASKAYDRYIDYSVKNNRAYYPMRVEI